MLPASGMLLSLEGSFGSVLSRGCSSFSRSFWPPFMDRKRLSTSQKAALTCSFRLQGGSKGCFGDASNLEAGGDPTDTPRSISYSKHIDAIANIAMKSEKIAMRAAAPPAPAGWGLGNGPMGFEISIGTRIDLDPKGDSYRWSDARGIDTKGGEGSDFAWSRSILPALYGSIGGDRSGANGRNCANTVLARVFTTPDVLVDSNSPSRYG